MNYLIHTRDLLSRIGRKIRYSRGRVFKCIIVMKIFLLLLSISLQVSAIASAQQVSLNVKNAKISTVLDAIQKQTGYGYGFSKDANLKDAKPVTISLKSASIETTVQIIFNDQPFEYEIDNSLKMIVIQPKKAAKSPGLIQTDDAGASRTTLTGLVRDPDGSPLPGVTVLVQGTKLGAVTDNFGRFSIANAPANGSLLIRMIGRENLDITYTNGLVPDIILKEVEADLNEIQVIAYGQVEKKYSTTSIGTIKGSDIQNQPVSNIQLAIAGRVPGIFVKQTAGVSSSDVDITIQGRNSLRNGSVPFYVIDGIPYSPQFTDNSLMGGAIVGFGGNALNFINPADIESISILKDADATAIYGSRAANGAILITTKKGKSGKTSIDVNLQNGWGGVTRKMDLLNTQQYLELRKEAYINAGQPIPTSETPPNTSNFDLTSWDQNKYTDWQEELIGGTALFTNLQASVSGGTANTQFLASYGFIRETTVYPGSPSDKKGNVRFSINHVSSNNRFKYLLSGSYLQDKNKLYNIDLMGRALTLAPNSPDMYNPDGSINFSPAPKNPNISTFRSNPATTIGIPFTGNTSNIIANNTISYEVIPGLEIKTSMGFNRLAGDENKFSPITIIRPELPTKIRTAQYLTKSMSSWIIEPQITYRKNTEFGVFDALIGGTIQQNSSNVLQQTGTGYNSDEALGDISAAATLKTDAFVKSRYEYNALFGRLNYRLMDKYIINLTARRDGSSRFGRENKLHNFYSAGGAWLFASEELFKQHLPWLSTGKLRANYGTTGNDQITDYRYLSLLNNFIVDLPYLSSNGIYPNNISNPYLQWEKTKKLNVGVDLGFIKDRIQIGINYFQNRSSNQLIRYDLASTSGFGSIDRNFPATVQNTGFELQADVSVLTSRSFNWRTSANITIPKNKLVEFPGLENTTYAEQYILGRSINLIRAYKYAGVNSSTGLYEVISAKGEKTSTPDWLTDRTELIDLNPKFYGGFSNSFQYKGLSLDILFQFVKQMGSAYRFGNAVGAFNANQPTYVLNRWRKEGDIAEIQRASVGFDVAEAYGAANSSDEAFTDASYIRLKNVSVSYTLPVGWLNRAHINNARVYLQGQNLLTITNYVGLDPETQSLSTPPLKIFSAGVQLTF